MSVLSQVLFLFFYLKVSDVYISNQVIFRSFHCTSLALLSLKNTLHYGLSSVVEPNHPAQTMLSNASFTLDYQNNQNGEDFFLKIIPFYFLIYLLL